MQRLFLFNPENDIALGQAQEQYTPSRMVMAFHNAGAALPFWYARCNRDLVYAPNIDTNWVQKMRTLFNLPAQIYSSEINNIEPMPWGLSLHALHQYRKLGLTLDMNYWRPRIQQIREYSHRHTAAKLLSKLRTILPYTLPPQPIEAQNVNEIIDYANHTPHFFMKAPWSSSGRGVINSAVIPLSQLLRQANGIIKHQGSVMLETALNKVLDFATLYTADNNGIHHLGYSIFFNSNGASSYSGNYVADDSRLLEMLTNYTSADVLTNIVHAVATVLTNMNLHKAYHGNFGVDMMVYKAPDNNQILINPAVEINLRMTMGIVAHSLAKHVLNPSQSGILSVKYAPHDTYGHNYHVSGKKLSDGTLDLIPFDQNFRITLTTSPTFKLPI